MGFLSNELQNAMKYNINIEVELGDDTGCGKYADVQGNIVMFHVFDTLWNI